MSNSLTRSEAVRKYFIETPSKPAEPDYSGNQTQIIMGGVLFFVAILMFFSGNGLFIFLGVVAGFFGFSSLSNGFTEYLEKKKNYEEACAKYKEDYAKAEPKPSDEQMDQWMENDIKKIIEQSLKRLDLEDEDYRAKPFWIGGPELENQKIPTQLRVGRDGKVRYSHLNILVIYLTEHNIATYQCTHNLINGQTLAERTQEFPYKEITNLEIQIEKKDLSIVNGRPELENGVQQFALYTAGANVIKVAYSFVESELIKIGSEDTIRAIRRKLEEYKKKYEK